MSQFFSSSGQSIKEFQLQHHSFKGTLRTDLLQDGLVGSPCSPRDSQESSPTPQFKSINSLALSFLYGPTLTSIHDYWKNEQTQVHLYKTSYTKSSFGPGLSYMVASSHIWVLDTWNVASPKWNVVCTYITHLIFQDFVPKQNVKSLL